jgi:isopenicillin N synthase-like dioxygenase
MRAIALGLGLDEMFFEDKINEQYHNLRLLSYPAIKTSLLKEGGRARVGPHTGVSHSEHDNDVITTGRSVDFGTLTLVFQDNVGGLEVENPHTKGFQHARPIVCLICSSM